MRDIHKMDQRPEGLGRDRRANHGKEREREEREGDTTPKGKRTG